MECTHTCTHTHTHTHTHVTCRQLVLRYKFCLIIGCHVTILDAEKTRSMNPSIESMPRNVKNASQGLRPLAPKREMISHSHLLPYIQTSTRVTKSFMKFKQRFRTQSQHMCSHYTFGCRSTISPSSRGIVGGGLIPTSRMLWGLSLVTRFLDQWAVRAPSNSFSCLSLISFTKTVKIHRARCRMPDFPRACGNILLKNLSFPTNASAAIANNPFRQVSREEEKKPKKTSSLKSTWCAYYDAKSFKYLCITLLFHAHVAFLVLLIIQFFCWVVPSTALIKIDQQGGIQQYNICIKQK